MKELENASAKVHISRLEALQTQMRQHVEVLTAKRQQGTSAVLGGIYKDNYYRSIFELQKGAGLGSSFAKLDTRQLENLLVKPWAPDGSNFSSRIWADRTKLVSELNTTLVQGLIRGDSSDKMITQLSERMGVSRSRAENLVLTESAYFSGASRRAAYDELGVEKYQNIATLDKRTSKTCRTMDKTIFPLAEAQPGVNCAPFHGRCRTVDIPYYEDNIKERAARGDDGKTYNVPGDMTYEQWAKEHAPVDAKKPPQLSSGNGVTNGVGGGYAPEPEKWYDETGKTAPKLLLPKDLPLNDLEPDRPRKLGDIDPYDQPAAKNFLTEAEKEIRKATDEHAVAITRDGEVYHVKGSRSAVNPEAIGVAKLKDAAITHNHPDYDGEPGGSFSPDDVLFFFRNGLRELRIVDSAYVYRLTKDEDLSVDLEDVMSLLSGAEEAAERNLTIEDAIAGYDLKHLVMLKLVELIKGLLYERND
ncbi:minor capsid protein [Paenibacillus sp. TAB 01]|uniref:minor capsid protein n=1 Tax=Paenibacillus sp. TAB 01 TaxID=3368988 RepID=UPI00375096A7